MQNKYIKEMLNIPELHINQILLVDENEVHIEAKPVINKQCCSVCNSDESVCLKGSNDLRKVRHLSVFGKKAYLIVPSIRMFCSLCEISLVWVYEFVGPKRRYSNSFRERAAEQAFGSTAAHSALMEQAPASTMQRFHNEAIPKEEERLSKQAWNQALANNELVLGVDDFAIKKGHNYNTGIHDLKGEMMLDLLPGRKLEELRTYSQQHPAFLLLNPKAVVMDLAKAYHTWIKECFPNAIRIADRFHVHGYIIEALQEVRKAIQGTLAPRVKAMLKANHRLLNPQEEALSEESRSKLNELLNHAPLLRKVWEWKEAFNKWYDYSPNHCIAVQSFKRWCEQGEAIDDEAVKSALKTMNNWREEITNYHHCRWTNATVEGRHNRIKAYQRRHYFTRNRDRYKAGILVECNRNRLN